MCVAVAGLTLLCPPQVAALDEAAQSGAILLKDSLNVYRSGRQYALITALRHLRDPSLRPYFEHLAASEHPVMRMHGIMGQAEISENNKLDLAALKSLDNPELLKEVVGNGAQAGLIDDDMALQMMSWDNLDNGVKLVAALKLVENGRYKDTAWLKRTLASGNILDRGIAGLLLTQLGDPAGLKELQSLASSSDPNADRVRSAIMSYAMAYNFNKIAPWTLELARNEKVSRTVSLQALQVAMKFGELEAYQLWTRQFNETDSAAHRNRLALAALNVSPWVDARLFETLLKSDDGLQQKMGAAGRAVASKKGVVPAVVALIETQYPLASQWALQYAEISADDKTAEQLLLALILAVEGPDRNRSRRFDHAVGATEALYETSPEAAARLLMPIMKSDETVDPMKRAIVLGLVQVKTGTPSDALVGVTRFGDRATNDMALLLKARDGKTLSPQEREHLTSLAMGGGQIPESLRIQAVWIYLKQSGQTGAALKYAMAD